MLEFELPATADIDDGAGGPFTGNGNVDVAFRKISKSSTDFLIWRVENMNLVALPRDQYGIFYDTDSYIVYAASQYGHSSGLDTVQREIKNGNLEYHIHFWLGALTTPEKSGVAAYKTVELDGYLNGCATQHRETQENESARFLSYFKNGFKILKPNDGGSSYPKLYKIKGKKVPILTEMRNLSWNHFNSSDVFIIYTKNTIFIWIGRASNAMERSHAAKIAEEMKEENNSITNIVFVDDGYEKTLPEDVRKEFNKYLPLEKRVVLPENSTNDSVDNNIQKCEIRLYRCSENSGKYRVAELKSGPFQQRDLNSEDVYIIDHETNGIWVWVGKRASDKERSEALRNARGFVKKKKYSNHTKVTRVVDGHEPLEFKLLFPTWKSEGRNPKPSILVPKFDAETLEDRPSLAAETQLIDDATGTLTIWRINQNYLTELPKERQRYFFSGDSYIILYSYDVLQQQKHLLYCWLGAHTSQEDINCATIKISEIDEELGHLGFQARVIQGNEPAHFLQLFKGRLIVFKGRGTDFDESGKNLKHPSQYLLQIFGSTTYSSKAMQVSSKVSSLNSNYCFVLKRNKRNYVWCGNYSTGDQREMAKLFAGKDFELVLEGKEKDEFFTLLGGKSQYFNHLVKNDFDPKPARLFHCNSAKGFNAEEIMFFTQKDLIPEHVMLLDANDSIYLWIGKLSSREEQRLSIKIAIDYLQTDPSGRDMNIPVIHIKQEREPPTFTGFFPTWNKKFWKNYKAFGKVRQEIEMKNTDSNGNIRNGGFTVNEKSGHSDFDQFDKYPINILKEPNDKLPARINPLNKELHLTHDDFVSMFKMTYIDFEKLPRWKQQELKKKVGLF